MLPPPPAYPPRTVQTPGVGGVHRASPEDFVVQELPLRPPAGQGDHLWLLVRKRNLSTTAAAGLLARALGVRPRDVRYAGMKDRVAVATQAFTVRVGDRDVVPPRSLCNRSVRVLEWSRTDRGLKRGELAGNRFTLLLRRVKPDALRIARDALDQLTAHGAPHAFGCQRFGARNLNHHIGAALARGRWRQALDLLLGCANAQGFRDLPARMAYEKGDLAEAIALTPPGDSPERRALEALRRNNDPHSALLALSSTQLRFYLSALQSAVFNALLTRRVKQNTWRRPLTGDIAAPVATLRDASSDAATQQDVCPTGPLWGPDMPRAHGEPGMWEAHALDEAGLSLSDLTSLRDVVQVGPLGARRPLRMTVHDASVEHVDTEDGPALRCCFTLPPGAFATIVLREIMGEAAVDSPAITAPRD